MATASSFLSEDQFLCSICLEVFTDPVSTPCGHNFCKACLTRHWGGKEKCQCPLCNEKFNKGLKLEVNTAFRDVVENFKRHHVRADNNLLVKPGQVPCDRCTDNKLRAIKTCLVCLASFCETHLEPHQSVRALKRHKLTNPVQNLEDKICKKHCRIFELFCRNDQTHICVLCTEHSAHDTFPLEEEYVDKKAHMGKRPEVQQIKQKGENKMRVAVQKKKKGKNGARAYNVVANEMLDPHIWLLPNQGPPCCCGYSYIPSDRGFSEGRFYYEVQTRGRTGWDVGVVRDSVRGRMTPRNGGYGGWIVRLGNNNRKARHNIPVLGRKPERVIVFVDYEKGLVSFYDVSNAALIYCFTDCKFNERIFLFISPSPSQNVRRAQQLHPLFFVCALMVVLVVCYIVASIIEI